jgi:hypothetical protein
MCRQARACDESGRVDAVQLVGVEIRDLARARADGDGAWPLATVRPSAFAAVAVFVLVICSALPATPIR